MAVTAPHIAERQKQAPRRGLAMRIAVRALLMAALCVLVAAVLLYFREPVFAQLGRWGYVGGFLVEFADSAFFFVPLPAPAVVFALASELNPWAMGLIAGLGAGLGTSVGYFAGTVSRSALERASFFVRFSTMTARWGGPFLFALALVPFPIDLVGTWAGAGRYPFFRFLLWITPAKMIKVTFYALAGGYGLDIIARAIGL